MTAGGKQGPVPEAQLLAHVAGTVIESGIQVSNGKLVTAGDANVLPNAYDPTERSTLVSLTGVAPLGRYIQKVMTSPGRIESKSLFPLKAQISLLYKSVAAQSTLHCEVSDRLQVPAPASGMQFVFVRIPTSFG